MRVRLLRLPHAADLPLPRYASAGAAGCDLRAAIDQPTELKAGQRRAVPTGLVLEIPSGYEAQVRPRSGLALTHGVTVANAPGTIDSDYRGEVVVILVNLGEAAYTLRRGDRIAQLVVARVESVEWEEAAELPTSERGSGGFGSTGRD